MFKNTNKLKNLTGPYKILLGITPVPKIHRDYFLGVVTTSYTFICNLYGDFFYLGWWSLCKILLTNNLKYFLEERAALNLALNKLKDNLDQRKHQKIDQVIQSTRLERQGFYNGKTLCF